MPSDAIVMPSWQADRYSSIWSICARASERGAAPPSSRICSSCAARARGRARTRPRRRSRSRARARGRRPGAAARSREACAAGRQRRYFEEVRRRSSGRRAQRSRATGARRALDPRRAARSRSAVSPPSECVVIVTGHLVPAEIARSGWWFISSATGVEPVDEATERREVLELEVLDDRVALDVQPRVGQALLDFLVAQKCHRASSMRIASLVPSPTELLFALGLGDQVVAVTHECDYPPARERCPHLTRERDPARACRPRRDRPRGPRAHRARRGALRARRGRAGGARRRT